MEQIRMERISKLTVKIHVAEYNKKKNLLGPNVPSNSISYPLKFLVINFLKSRIRESESIIIVEDYKSIESYTVSTD